MHGVAGALRNHVPQQRTANQSQIADQVQRLVPAALVGEAHSAFVKHRGLIETDGVFQRCATNQAHVAQLCQFVFKSECPCGRDLGGVVVGGNFHFQALMADFRVVEKDLAG